MIVEMRRGASSEEIERVVQRAKSFGFGVQLNQGTDKTVVAILGSYTGSISTDTFAVLAGVESVARIMKPYKLASREVKNQDTIVKVGGVEVGGKRIVVMAGPCAVESEHQIMESARAVVEDGACVVRGGAYKPRSSPFSFQGLEKKGLEMLARVREVFKVPVVSEIVDVRDVDLVSRFVDILQVGARNMQNFTLLKELGRSKQPVVLKRGLSATVTEWLNAADYLLAEGNEQIILCERGIRTFEDSARFSLDMTSIPVIKRYSHLPIIVDPSHAAGHYTLVPSLARAAIAGGADGLLIEVHPNPEEALVDGLQSLTFKNFRKLMAELKLIAQAVNRTL